MRTGRDGDLDTAPQAAGPDPAHPRLVSQRRFEERAFDALDSTTLAAVGVGRLSHAAPVGLPFWPLFTFRET